MLQLFRSSLLNQLKFYFYLVPNNEMIFKKNNKLKGCIHTSMYGITSTPLSCQNHARQMKKKKLFWKCQVYFCVQAAPSSYHGVRKVVGTKRVTKAVTLSAVHVLERLWQRDTVKHLFNYKKKKVRRGLDLDKNFKGSLKSLRKPHFQFPGTNWSLPLDSLSSPLFLPLSSPLRGTLDVRVPSCERLSF